MDFKTLIQEASDLIEGTYSEYDDLTTVVIVPIDEHRFQTVFAHYNDGLIMFNSKACDPMDEMPYKAILEHNSLHKLACLELENGYLYVTGYALPGSAPKGIADVLKQVAVAADTWEHKLTGQDVN